MILDDLADFTYSTNFNDLSEKMIQDIEKLKDKVREANGNGSH